MSITDREFPRWCSWSAITPQVRTEHACFPLRPQAKNHPPNPPSAAPPLTPPLELVWESSPAASAAPPNAVRTERGNVRIFSQVVPSVLLPPPTPARAPSAAHNLLVCPVRSCSGECVLSETQNVAPAEYGNVPPSTAHRVVKNWRRGPVPA